MNVFVRYWQYAALAAVSAMVFCFWLFLFPFVPVVRELSQLFLWTGGYFMERIEMPGGMAQYLGEMIAQFFINPVNGALAYTLIFVVVQQMSARWLRQSFPMLKVSYRFLFSLIVPVVLMWLALLPHVPLTPTMAVMMVMAAGCGVVSLPQAKRLWVLLPTIAVMCWLAGPAAVLLVFCCIRWLPLTAALFTACLVGSSYLVPYPLRQVVRGIDYFAAEGRIGLQMSTYEEMECDMLFRQGEWQQIVSRFQHPVSPAVHSAVLIAYHKTGRMSKLQLMARLVVPAGQEQSAPSVFNIGDRQFVVSFGSVSSAFMLSDMAYHLYWTYISQRAAFEAMEYIPNYNKSGRALKRLVETNIISGHYDVARKYIAILEKTTFYRKWAQSMRRYVDNPEIIEDNPHFKATRKEYANTADVFFI